MMTDLVSLWGFVRRLGACTKILCSALLVFLGACATAPTGVPSAADFSIVKESDEYYVLRLRDGQSIEDAADVFLKDRHAAWQIQEVNALAKPEPGELVAVPKQAINITGVYPDGYRTVPILCYHQFTGAGPSGNKLELRAADFEAQLRYLKERNYQTLSFAELAGIMRSERPVPVNAVVLTIDDGYASVYDVAWPLLKKYQMKATLFVYTDFIGAGAALNWEQLREMRESGLIEVESHGKSHASLAPLSEDVDERSYRNRLAAELSASEAVFMAKLGSAPDYLSYPYGNSSTIIAKMLKDNGYQLAATVTRGPNGSFVDPFLLHRTMIYDTHSLADFEGFLQGFSERPRPR